METDPEHESIESFVEYLFDEDRSSYDYEDLKQLMGSLRRSAQVVREELCSWGLTLVERQKERKVRGLNSNNHDRWASSGCHGGSGYEQISGFAGKAG